MQEEQEFAEKSKRFLEVISKLTDEDGRKISAYKLDKKYNIATQSQITHIKSGRNNPSDEIINNLSNAFPKINPAYIYVGTLPMFYNYNGQPSETINIDNQTNVIVPHDAWDMIKSQQGIIASMQKKIDLQEKMIDDLNKKINFLKSQINDYTEGLGVAGDAQSASAV